MDDFILNCGKKGYAVDIVLSNNQEKLTQKFVMPIIDKLMNIAREYQTPKDIIQ